MTEVAQATVTIIPNMKGAQATISSELGASAEPAAQKTGLSIGKNLVGTISKVVAAAGIGKLVADTLNAGGALQQSFGGLETLYGDAAEYAKEYAYMAASAGISANDYAEQAVSFGAALKSAFGGDTEKAVEAANTAIMDMTDNAAKMGTPIESIQNAYQGFAKGQYNMLDNLKLGYGGTKTEMERLLADASKLSGVEYNIDNLGDVYDAIHVIQEDLGLTGVAAEEAATTFSGSFGAMQANAKNLMADLALGNDIRPTLNALANSVKTFLVGNLLPMIGNILKQLPTFLAMIPGFLADMIPDIVACAVDIIAGLGDGIVNGIPTFIAGIGELFGSLVTALVNIDWGAVCTGLLNGLTAAVSGIWNSITELLRVEFGIDLPDFETVVADISALWEEVKAGIVDFFKAAFDILTDDDTTIIEKIGALWELVKAGIADYFKTVFSMLLPTAESIISSISSWWGENIWPSIQDFFQTTFGINLPSWDDIAQTISDGWATIKEDVAALFNVLFGVGMPSFQDVVSAITTLWGDVWDGIVGFFETTFDIHIPTWEDLKEAVTQLWTNFKAGIADFFKTTFNVELPSWDDVKEAISTGWDTVKKGIGNIFSWVFSLGFPDIEGIVADLKEWWGGVVKSIGDFFTLKWILDDAATAEEASKTIVDEHGQVSYGGTIDIGGDKVNVDSKAIQDALSSANLTLADVDTSSIDAAKEAVAAGITDMETAFSNAKLALPSVEITALLRTVQAIATYVSIFKRQMKFSWTLPTPHGWLPQFTVTMKEAGDGTTKTSYPVFTKSLQWFAKGGIFDAPSVIGVGEAGPEAVVPLDKMWREMERIEAKSGQTNIYQTFNVDGAQDPELWAASAARTLKRELRMA